MKEAVLILIKPDCISRGLEGVVFLRLSQLGLKMIACRMVRADRDTAEEHYRHLSKKPFFDQVVRFSLGEFHSCKHMIALVYFGESAVKKCRQLAGETHPEVADSLSLRGSLGRVTSEGLFENVVHVSSNKKEAEREIKLWFSPGDISVKIFSIKKIDVDKKSSWGWA